MCAEVRHTRASYFRGTAYVNNLDNTFEILDDNERFHDERYSNQGFNYQTNHHEHEVEHEVKHEVKEAREHREYRGHNYHQGRASCVYLLEV